VIVYVDEEMITATWRDTHSTQEYHFPSSHDEGEVFRLPQR